MFRMILVAALALAAPALAARGRSLTLDPRTTEITFTLGATLHEVEGSFRLLMGEIRFDSADGRASGRIEIDASSGRTGNARRDRKMHSTVLESDDYPMIVLEPERIEGNLEVPGSSELVLHGNLSIHGSSHPLRIAARVEIRGSSAEVTAHFAVPYVAWGLEDPSVFVLRVKKHVDVTVRMTARLAGDAPPLSLEDPDRKPAPNPRISCAR